MSNLHKKSAELGTAAIDLARSGRGDIAQVLKHGDLYMEWYPTRFDMYGKEMDHRQRAVLLLPIDLLDEWKEEYEAPALEAFRKASAYSGTSFAQLRVAAAPTPDGWRERLDLLSDWGTDRDDWWSLNEKVGELKDLHRRAVTTEDFKDVGRRSRDLVVAAVRKVFRPSMVPDGVEQPKGDDAKGKFDFILSSRVDGASNERLRKFMRSTLELAHEVTHDHNADRLEAFAAAQGTVALVRILAQLDDELHPT